MTKFFPWSKGCFLAPGLVLGMVTSDEGGGCGGEALDVGVKWLLLLAATLDLSNRA